MMCELLVLQAVLRGKRINWTEESNSFGQTVIIYVERGVAKYATFSYEGKKVAHGNIDPYTAKSSVAR